jgi:hypothetical protein
VAAAKHGFTAVLNFGTSAPGHIGAYMHVFTDKRQSVFGPEGSFGVSWAKKTAICNFWF